jgi:hypothetical protein
MSYTAGTSLKNALVHLFTIKPQILTRKMHFTLTAFIITFYLTAIHTEVIHFTDILYVLKTFPFFFRSLEDHNFFMSIKKTPSLVNFSIWFMSHLFILCILVLPGYQLHDLYNSFRCLEINSTQQHSKLVTLNAAAHITELFFFHSTLSTCPCNTSLVSLIYIMLQRTKYHTSENFMTNIHTTVGTVLKQKSPIATFTDKNLFCGLII